MGWNWRRRIGVGPFRVNLSKKGAGYSVGIKGFRVGHNWKGQQYSQTSIPGTGIYRRSLSGNRISKNWVLAIVLAILVIYVLMKIL